MADSQHSTSTLQDETKALKADGEKLAAEKSALEKQLADLRSSATDATKSAAQLAQTEEQLRQAQTWKVHGALATENAQLKTRLAASVPVVISAPTRPNAPFPAPAAPPRQRRCRRSRTHVARDGRHATPRFPAYEYYGVSTRWPDILAANKDVLKDEKSLVVGRTLAIP